MFSSASRLDTQELNETVVQRLKSGASLEVAGAIFQRDSDVLGRAGLDEEERDFRDRVG